MRKISSTIVSQHPDHASIPYWHKKEFISTRYEVKECFLSFSDLGSLEYKWDWEGKYVDESVVEHLLSEHFDFFKSKPLGKETFLTFRLPNPKVETEFRLGRAFMIILGASGLAKQVGLPTPSLFEVILPMAECAEEMISIQEAFCELAQLKHPLHRIDNVLIKNIEIIPLFEQVQTIIHSDQILRDYLTLHQIEFGYKPKYLRPYVARSDPALNSGIVPTILAIKIALSRYKSMSEEEGIELFPIIGSASLPFRGGLTPFTVSDFADEYKGIKTALIQSAFRYDYPKEKVVEGIKLLSELLPKREALEISRIKELKIREFIPIFELYYRKTIEGIAPLINDLATKLPSRRERVQHIGLFGYSRGMGKVKLPRAIGFTAVLYSLGIPPELIGTGRGLKAVKKMRRLSLLEESYLNIKKDLERAGRFVNKSALHKLAKKSSHWQGVLEDVREIEKYLKKPLGPITKEEKEHQKLALETLKLTNDDKDLTEVLNRSAVLRKSLG